MASGDSMMLEVFCSLNDSVPLCPASPRHYELLQEGQGFARIQGGPRPVCIAAPPLPAGAGDGSGENRTWHRMLASKNLCSGRSGKFLNLKLNGEEGEAREKSK